MQDDIQIIRAALASDDPRENMPLGAVMRLLARLEDRERRVQELAGEVSALLARGVRVSIPTDTMEQEFSSYHRKGYAAGRAQALEEAAQVADKYHGSAARAIRALAGAPASESKLPQG